MSGLVTGSIFASGIVLSRTSSWPGSFFGSGRKRLLMRISSAVTSTMLYDPW
jgi:hypothetical protein